MSHRVESVESIWNTWKYLSMVSQCIRDTELHLDGHTLLNEHEKLFGMNEF